MTDIADKFKEKLENSKSQKPVDLLILINKSLMRENYSVRNNNGDSKILISQGNNQNLMCQLKEYLNSIQKSDRPKYDFCEMYGFIQTELTAKEAKLLYGNNLFKDKITLLPGDLTVILKP